MTTTFKKMRNAISCLLLIFIGEDTDDFNRSFMSPGGAGANGHGVSDELAMSGQNS